MLAFCILNAILCLMVIKRTKIKSFIEESNQKIADKTSVEDLKKTLSMSLNIVDALCDRVFKSSSNSNIPPSQDPHRLRKRKKTKGKKRKPGGQKGHRGSTLEQSKSPDEIEEISIDMSSLPEGRYKCVGYDSRQVMDIEISTHIKEYRAEILENENGEQYVAEFPEGVNKAVQYGNGVKSHSAYLSNYQLIPLDRVREHFAGELGLPISKGTVSNINDEVVKKLKSIGFEEWIKRSLINSGVVNADETGSNVNGIGHWLHSLSTSKLTLYHMDAKRGSEAMDRMGVLAEYKGILCHDHWSSYYKYACKHSLCNAHHQRELEYAFENDGQEWADKMFKILVEIKNKVDASPKGYLTGKEIERYEKRYYKILLNGRQECPLAPRELGKKGRQKKSKSRNLLDRLLNFKDDTLRFMKESDVPYTNNTAERDIRMAKLYQNISKCFRTLEGAQKFCLRRSYIATAKKNGISPTDALHILFEGKIPFFMRE